MEYLYIAIGSGTGGLLRYLFSKWTHSLFGPTDHPFLAACRKSYRILLLFK